LQTNSTTIPTNAQLLLNESLGLFDNGSYTAAENAANQAYQLSTQNGMSVSGTGNNFFLIGAAAAGIVIIAVIVAFRAKRQKSETQLETPGPKSVSSPAAGNRLCTACGAVMQTEDDYCSECGKKN
jgi:hypothetical protein